jgi:hypothetical protein
MPRILEDYVMSADADVHYSRKPFLLTLKGMVTVQYLDGQTLEGEIAAQDDLNIWLKVGDTPYLLPRSQIRYIKGLPGQSIEPETEQEAPATAPPSLLDTSPGVSQLAEVEQAIPAAHFVEEIEIPPVEEDTGGTIIIPTGIPSFPSSVEQTEIHTPVEEISDVGTTMILAPGSESPAVSEEAPIPGDVGITPTDLGETELLPALEDNEDATFVLRQKDADEISAHLICTAGPHAGEVLKLKPGIITIGRSSDNALALSKDKEVSRRHALIVYEANNFVLQDQNSLNGTFVNDQLIKEPRPLQDGDIILIGVSTLKFQESPKK